MISIEEAKAIADTRLEDITECKEMVDAYIFSNPRTKYSIGGPDAPVIVMKEDGRVVSSVEYYSGIGCGEEIRTIKYVDYVEPADYFTPEMLKVADEWEKANELNPTLLKDNINWTGFAAPMEGIQYPKGSKLKYNDDGTVTVIPPEE